MKGQALRNSDSSSNHSLYGRDLIVTGNHQNFSWRLERFRITDIKQKKNKLLVQIITSEPSAGFSLSQQYAKMKSLEGVGTEVNKENHQRWESGSPKERRYFGSYSGDYA